MGEIKNNPAPQADPSSEIEGLVDALVKAAKTVGRERAFGELGGVFAASNKLKQARAALLSRLSPTPTEGDLSTPSPQGGTVGRAPQQVHDTNSNGEATGRDAAHLEWAVSRWNTEVANRPVRNVHRRALDDTWRQAIRRFGGDPDALVGPSHDALIADGLSASPRPSHEGMSDASNLRVLSAREDQISAGRKSPLAREENDR